MQRTALTSLQAGMLFQARLDPNGGFDVEQLTMDLKEPIDVAAFERAWSVVVARHPMLRTRFVDGDDGDALQETLAQWSMPVQVYDWRDVGDDSASATPDLDDDSRAERIEAFLRADRKRGFQLDDGPPLRLMLARVGVARTFACWTFHHIILDGRSFALVLRDVFAAYTAICRGQAPTLVLPPPPRPFSDFVAWTKKQRFAESLPFWRGLLAGKDAPTPLPTLRAPTKTPTPPPLTLTRTGYGELNARVAAKTTVALRALAKRTNTTLGTVVQGAWALALNRLTGDDDVVFGTTRACRKSAFLGDAVSGQSVGADDMVGLFINTLPVRARIVDTQPLAEFLGALRRQSLDVRDHEHTPLVDVLGQAQVQRGTPLFQTLLMFENQELNATLRDMDPAFEKRHFHYEEQPTFPLNVTVFDRGSDADGAFLELRVLFDRARYADVAITKLMTWIEAVMSSMTTATTTAEVRLLPDAERAELLFGAHNSTSAPFPDSTLIHELFEARADDAANANRIAVVCQAEDGDGGDDVTLTFGELERRANQLAWHLKAHGAVVGSYVGILLERRVDLVVALMAVAKTGAAYVPLDPDYPKDRLSFMLTDTDAPVVVTQAKYRDLLPDDASVVVIDDDDTAAAVAAASVHRPEKTARATDVAYTIYTSGSTGQPKGVVLTHEAVVNTLDWVNREFAFTSDDRLLFVTSVCFDLSVFDVFGALGAGASIRVASSAELRDPERLVARLSSGEISVWDSAPAALSRLVPFFPSPVEGTQKDSDDARRRRRLRLVMLSGDWIPVSLPGSVREAFHKDVALRSLGGATEAAIWSNFFVIKDVPSTWTSIPYGRPIQNAHYHVLDRRLDPVPPGINGDLYIGGTCLASGYLNRAELSAERFIADPFVAEAKRRGVPRPGHGRLYKTGDLARYYDDDGALTGELEFMGRADFQVKIRGFRVELGEVDATITKLDDVRDALSVALVDASNQKVLVTYVVPKKGRTLTASVIKDFAATALPEFMVPTHVVVMPTGLPVTVNGKVDRKALPDPLAADVSRVHRAPSTDTERRLLPIWQEVLRAQQLSVDDNFFDKGGHSLLATMLVSRIKKDLGVVVPLSALFAANTVEKLARSMEAAAATASSAAEASSAAAAASAAASLSSSSSLITLNASGSQTPVFFVAGIGGHVFTFQKLAALLGPDTPTYGFRAIGGESGEIPKASVEEIADAYLAELDDRGLTKEPIVLCGYSFGGYVAYELALRLEERGIQPKLLVLFDVLAPGYPRRLPTHERALLHADEFLKRDLKGKSAYVGERVGNVRRRLFMRFGLAARLAGDADVGAGDFDEARQGEMRALWGALATAQLQYRPKRRTGIPGLLLKAAITFDWPATRFDDPTHGWRTWLEGRLDVVTVDGAHLQLFEGENPGRMAQAILTTQKQ
jgi:amino acid adenylation domain-containing protein